MFITIDVGPSGELAFPAKDDPIEVEHSRITIEFPDPPPGPYLVNFESFAWDHGYDRLELEIQPCPSCRATTPALKT